MSNSLTLREAWRTKKPHLIALSTLFCLYLVVMCIEHYKSDIYPRRVISDLYEKSLKGDLTRDRTDKNIDPSVVDQLMERDKALGKVVKYEIVDHVTKMFGIHWGVDVKVHRSKSGIHLEKFGGNGSQVFSAMETIPEQ